MICSHGTLVCSQLRGLWYTAGSREIQAWMVGRVGPGQTQLLSSSQLVDKSGQYNIYTKIMLILMLFDVR